MELETVVSLSKAEALRELIIEKLTAAAQLIFAGVEKTVAAYEEEASAFRQEIDRQRRQLEVAPPEIKVETTGRCETEVKQPQAEEAQLAAKLL